MKKNKLIYDVDLPERVDYFLNEKILDYSRTYFQKLIKNGHVLVNDKQVLPSHKLKKGDEIVYSFEEQETSISLKPEKIPLKVIYEDDDIILINKQSDIVVHQSFGHESGTLLNALLWHFKGKTKPFMVHRLDKDTTGAIIFAKNEKAKVSLSRQFQKRAVNKTYITAVSGIINEDQGRIEAPLGRSRTDRKIIEVGPFAKRMAITEFKVLSRTKQFTLLEVRIITGRTHQIRSHMKYIGHPVLGDVAYGGCTSLNNVEFKRQMLHSYKIRFSHPGKGKMVEFIADIPKDMAGLFKNIKI
ncbi:MAG: RluA family pseudouridine synthase [Endomicrobiaceae bacterium]|nr:RluA family pseudouridine synthase [Endomicrobiaceae bacterium]